MTWNDNGGAPPDIGFRGGQNPTHSCTKFSMNCITMESNPNIISWIYMDSSMGSIVYNQFIGYLENFQGKMKGVGG